jgi:hypothetical protein
MSSSVSGGTTKFLFIMNLCQTAVWSTWMYYVYSQQSEKMYTVLFEKYPALVNRKRVLLQQDNARPHMAKKTLQKIEELEGIELLPHPVFSPDLEPSHYGPVPSW